MGNVESQAEMGWRRMHARKLAVDRMLEKEDKQRERGRERNDLVLTL